MHAISTPPWETVTAPPVLDQGQVHLWYLDLATVECDTTLLSGIEQERMHGFLYPQGARDFCAMRSQLKHLIGSYCDCPASAVALAIEDGGKPLLAHPQSNLRFNISHSHGIGLLAFARDVALGVDIECRRPIANWRRIAQRSFDPALVQSLPQQTQPPDAFFRLWTALEARQKCFGKGIFTARVSPDRVGLRQFEPARGQYASVAWERPDWSPALCFLRS